MSFLYPQFLYGLFALAIPIIVHLFNFRRTRKIYFSNTQFLKKVKEASSSKLKLKHYLILLSRLLFIFFLVMAFAQPVLHADENIQNQNEVSIYLDNSLSMSNEVDENLTALDAALNYIEELANLMPATTNYKLLTNDFEPNSNVFKSKSELLDIITEIGFSGSSRSAEDIKNRLTNQMSSENIYWISDFQQSTSDLTQSIDFDSIINVNLIPLEFNSVKNVSVDSLYLENPFLIGNERLKLNVMVKNWGLAEVQDLIVKVYVDDVQAATASVNLEANDVQTISFDLAFDLNGINKCKIAFEEFPVTFDNEFFFTLNGSNKITILEIKDHSETTSIEQVYGNPELFNMQSINISNLDYNLINLADLVIVNGLSTLDASLVSVLNKYLSEFGNVCLIPSVAPDAQSYRQVLGLQNLNLTDSVIMMTLGTPDFSNPFFQDVFEERTGNLAMPSASQLINWGPDRTAILKFENGEPFLSKMEGNGNLYIMASPIIKENSTFQSHALFVPVMYRIAVESASSEHKLYCFIDETIIRVKNDSLITGEIFKLKNESVEIIPEQRINGNSVLLQVPKYQMEVGFYDLMQEDKKINTFAFNSAFSESDLKQYMTDEITQHFKGNITLFNTSDKAEFTSAVEHKYIGFPLWKYAIVLALLFLLCEVLIIRFFP